MLWEGDPTAGNVTLSHDVAGYDQLQFGCCYREDDGAFRYFDQAAPVVDGKAQALLFCAGNPADNLVRTCLQIVDAVGTSVNQHYGRWRDSGSGDQDGKQIRIWRVVGTKRPA